MMIASRKERIVGVIIIIMIVAKEKVAVKIARKTS